MMVVALLLLVVPKAFGSGIVMIRHVSLQYRHISNDDPIYIYSNESSSSFEKSDSMCCPRGFWAVPGISRQGLTTPFNLKVF